MKLANMSNGLCYPHDGICYFQSMYAHHAKLGYFRIDSMPVSAVVALLRGEKITIIDATAKKKLLSDAMKFGVPTWCLVFNRAIGQKKAPVCSWATKEMIEISHSPIHKQTVQTIRKLVKIYDYVQPAIIGENVIIECHNNVSFDDKPNIIASLIGKRTEK